MSLFKNHPTILIFILLSLCNTSYATVYFSWDAENHPCDGSELPNPPFWTQTVAYRGHAVCEPSPQGSRHFEFLTVDNQTQAYTEIHDTQGLPIVSNVLGRTFYLAFYFNFTRIGGLDIYHSTGSSGDKGLEILGSGIRWTLGRGHWGSSIANLSGHYTIFGGNPTYHLNRALEVADTYPANQSGYSTGNTLQLPYDTWHSAVVALKIASDNTGSYTTYINGVKIIEYLNIRTTATNTPTINDISLGGTIAQGALDSPAHHRKFDALMLTDNWQDVIDAGYMNAVPSSPILSVPQVP